MTRKETAQELEVLEVAKLGHAEDCPAERMERYTNHTPDGTPVTITRCIDCGAQYPAKAAAQTPEAQTSEVQE